MPSEASLIIRKPGMLTTIQDAGRYGYHHLGVPVSGPMDGRSARIANMLVGNDPGNPVLEMTLIGPEIEIEGFVHIALTGADLKPEINNKPVSMYKTLPIDDGSVITLKQPPEYGCRAYLAVGGSWHVPNRLGSASMLPSLPETILPTVLKDTKIKITTIPTSNAESCPGHLRFSPQAFLRVLPGPEYHLLGMSIRETIFNTPLTLSPASNRMGYRLDPAIDVTGVNFSMISSAVLPGTVQLTPSGQLVLLMRDAQTMGGYPRVLQVIMADMDKAGQFKPGDRFQFKLTNLQTARKAWKKYLNEEIITQA